MEALKNIFINKINVLSIFIALLGAFMLIPNYFEASVMPLPLAKDLWMSLDPSWGIALNYVKLKNLTWGTDVAFTYGPLALFCTRIGWGETRISFILFDLFMFINYFSVFFVSLKLSRNKIITLFTIIVVCVLYPLWAGAANSLILMAMLVFWIRLSLDSPKPIYYIFQIAIITLIFFIKFNTGLIAFPLFIIGVVCNLVTNNGNKTLLISYLISPFLLIAIAAFPLNVALFSYIKSGFEIVSGYNDIMYLDNQIERSVLFAVFTVLVSTIILISNIYSKQKEEWIKGATILFLFGTSVFILYKQAFVRADINHINDFFRFMPLIILCNLDLHRDIKNIYTKVLYFFILGFPIYFLLIKQNNQTEIKAKFQKSEYFITCRNFTSTSGMFINDNYSQLPTSVIKKIGKATVDVYPWNIQLLLENKLNYFPRPVLQSYTVYTPYLEQMDFNHYNSSKAPEFVIYDFASIDGRYPLFDESKLNLALCRNYQVSEFFDFDGRKMILFQKKTEFKPITFEKIKEYAMYINSPLVPRKDIYYEIGIYNSLSGKIASVFQHAPEIRLEIKLKEGYSIEFRTSKLLLETGLFSDMYMSDTKSFKTFFDKVNENQKIKYYKFIPLQPSFFKEKIRIVEYKIKQ